jgi:cation/acetate symporter
VMSAGTLVPNQNLAAPLLAREVGGDIFLSFVAAIAFATILAVVAGLTIAASSAFAHDIWFTVVKRQQEDEREQVLVARVTATVIGLVSIVLAIALRSLNVAFLVGLAFAVAASANVPAILLTLYWRRFNTTGMVVGMLVGLLSAIVLIVLSPAVMGVDAAGVAARHLIQRPPIFPLDNPAIVSVPLGFLAAVAGTFLGRDSVAEAAYSELNVRANTGLGAV